MNNEPVPDFSGVWQLNLEKSTFRGPSPREILTNIEHREPMLIQTTLIVAADGGEQLWIFTLDTSGSESTNTTTAGEVQSRAHWNGSELVIDSVLRTPGRTFHFSDHWSLSHDRQTLKMAHPDDDLAGQVAILEKASPDAAARFKRQ
ncbi:MAG TPA: hypothetical protein VKE96_23385 [Vicinamibacterales bacterium]|nr:hypothetical protein [Vicinamibacterales bacterium]